MIYRYKKNKLTKLKKQVKIKVIIKRIKSLFKSSGKKGL